MSNLLTDLRYGFRMPVKHPGVTAAAVLSLSIGIGGNATGFILYSAFCIRYSFSDERHT